MLDNFKFWCQKVIPLVFDDSVSYYETLCKVSAKLNEVINTINEMDPVSHEELKQALDDLYVKITLETNDKDAKIYTYINEQVAILNSTISQQISQLKSYSDSEDNKIRLQIISEVEKLNKTINLEIAGLRKEMLSITGSLQHQIDEISSVTSYVISPFSGELVTFQQAINELANFHKNGLTAIDYDNLNLTAKTYDDKNLTAFDYDFNGKNLLTTGG